MDLRSQNQLSIVSMKQLSISSIKPKTDQALLFTASRYQKKKKSNDRKVKMVVINTTGSKISGSIVSVMQTIKTETDQALLSTISRYPRKERKK